MNETNSRSIGMGYGFYMPIAFGLLGLLIVVYALIAILYWDLWSASFNSSLWWVVVLPPLAVGLWTFMFAGLLKMGDDKKTKARGTAIAEVCSRINKQYLNKSDVSVRAGDYAGWLEINYDPSKSKLKFNSIKFNSILEGKAGNVPPKTPPPNRNNGSMGPNPNNVRGSQGPNPNNVRNSQQGPNNNIRNSQQGPNPNNIRNSQQGPRPNNMQNPRGNMQNVQPPQNMQNPRMNANVNVQPPQMQNPRMNANANVNVQKPNLMNQTPPPKNMGISNSNGIEMQNVTTTNQRGASPNFTPPGRQQSNLNNSNLGRSQSPVGTPKRGMSAKQRRFYERLQKHK
jgi:hypothetical protein